MTDIFVAAGCQMHGVPFTLNPYEQLPEGHMPNVKPYVTCVNVCERLNKVALHRVNLYM